jgi:hypothetical protein
VIEVTLDTWHQVDGHWVAFSVSVSRSQGSATPRRTSPSPTRCSKAPTAWSVLPRAAYRARPCSRRPRFGSGAIGAGPLRKTDRERLNGRSRAPSSTSRVCTRGCGGVCAGGGGRDFSRREGPLEEKRAPVDEAKEPCRQTRAHRRA